MTGPATASTPARVQITQAAKAAGWTTDPGYRGPEAGKSAAWAGTGPGRRHLNVRFSATGGLTWACSTDGRYDGPGRLARVLAYVRGEPR